MSKPLFDVIIVLGAAQNPDGTAGPAMTRRVRHAIRCFAEGKAAVILMAGGRTICDVPECVTMAELAQSEGLPPEVICQEPFSTRTLENAIECKKNLTEKGWASALLVTDGFHMPRSLYTFRAFGMNVSGDAVALSPTLYTMLAIVRETVARLFYPGKIKKYLSEEQ